jgi:hypothetical protein
VPRTQVADHEQTHPLGGRHVGRRRLRQHLVGPRQRGRAHPEALIDDLDQRARALGARDDPHDGVRPGERGGVLQQLGEEVDQITDRVSDQVQVVAGLVAHPLVLLDLGTRREQHGTQPDRSVPPSAGLRTGQHQQALVVAPHAGGEVVELEQVLQLVRIALLAFELVEEFQLPLDQDLTAAGQVDEHGVDVAAHQRLLDRDVDGAAVHRHERLGQLAELVLAAEDRRRHVDRADRAVDRAQPVEGHRQLDLGDAQRLTAQQPHRPGERAPDQQRDQHGDQEHRQDAADHQQGVPQLPRAGVVGLVCGGVDDLAGQLVQQRLPLLAGRPPLRRRQRCRLGAAVGQRLLLQFRGGHELRIPRQFVVAADLLGGRRDPERAQRGELLGPQVGQGDLVVGVVPAGPGGRVELGADPGGQLLHPGQLHVAEHGLGERGLVIAGRGLGEQVEQGRDGPVIVAQDGLAAHHRGRDRGPELRHLVVRLQDLGVGDPPAGAGLGDRLGGLAQLGHRLVGRRLQRLQRRDRGEPLTGGNRLAQRRQLAGGAVALLLEPVHHGDDLPADAHLLGEVAQRVGLPDQAPGLHAGQHQEGQRRDDQHGGELGPDPPVPQPEGRTPPGHRPPVIGPTLSRPRGRAARRVGTFAHACLLRPLESATTGSGVHPTRPPGGVNGGGPAP